MKVCLPTQQQEGAALERGRGGRQRRERAGRNNRPSNKQDVERVDEPPTQTKR